MHVRTHTYTLTHARMRARMHCMVTNGQRSEIFCMHFGHCDVLKTQTSPINQNHENRLSHKGFPRSANYTAEDGTAVLPIYLHRLISRIGSVRTMSLVRVTYSGLTLWTDQYTSRRFLNSIRKRTGNLSIVCKIIVTQSPLRYQYWSGTICSLMQQRLGWTIK